MSVSGSGMRNVDLAPSGESTLSRMDPTPSWSCSACGGAMADKPLWWQPRGKCMVSLVNSHTHATRIGWHLWEIDLRFAPGLPPGWIASSGGGMHYGHVGTIDGTSLGQLWAGHLAATDPTLPGHLAV